MRTCLIVLALVLCSSAAQAVESKPMHVWIKDFCTGPLGQEIVTSLRQEIRASAGYQLAASLADDGGDQVVVTIYITCTESTWGNTRERVVSLASIFGTGVCTLGSCSITSNEGTLGALLCSGKSGVGCGKDIYVELDNYMSKEGGEMFRRLSESRKKDLKEFNK
jgi:hypothetical protein